MKNQVYLTAVEQIQRGKSFSIDFKERTLKVNGKKLIDHGSVVSGEQLTGQHIELGEVLRNIERLYSVYKHSIPSEQTECKRKKYFQALPEHELSAEDMLYGTARLLAQFILEYYVLELIITGELRWDEDIMGKWFWQSKQDKDLILLREWVE